MTEPLKFKKRLGAKNQGMILSLPKELSEWLDLRPGMEINLIPETGKYGKFIALFVSKKNGELLDTDTQPTEEL